MSRGKLGLIHNSTVWHGSVPMNSPSEKESNSVCEMSPSTYLKCLPDLLFITNSLSQGIMESSEYIHRVDDRTQQIRFIHIFIQNSLVSCNGEHLISLGMKNRCFSPFIPFQVTCVSTPTSTSLLHSKMLFWSFLLPVVLFIIDVCVMNVSLTVLSCVQY